MCTAVTFQGKDHYFGRTLDLDHSYNESITVMPRYFPLCFRCLTPVKMHLAVIGVATVVDNYPLFYDAVNECGLSMAGLNFPGNAVYRPIDPSKANVATFEFIPWVLCQCKTIQDAKELLTNLNLTDISFSPKYPATSLHWIISDRNTSIVVESTHNGLSVYGNQVGVLTNNPEFPYHMRNLVNFANLTPDSPQNRFMDKFPTKPDSLGLGAVGLPGDLSSQSRFIRALFHKSYAIPGDTEEESVAQFFHILDSVSVVNGSVRFDNRYHKTVYTSCCNTDKMIYYYKTYNNNQISAVELSKVDLDRDDLSIFPFVTEQQIRYLNA